MINMNEERTSKKYSSSKMLECKMCKKNLPRNKLTFGYCHNGLICLSCYKSQFTPTPMYPTPVKLKSYRDIDRYRVKYSAR